MAYIGGKSKKYNHITDILNNKCFDNFDYLEPFVGYGHILRRVVNKKSYMASDSNELLIQLLNFVQNTNKKYPKISEKEYIDLKNDKSVKNRVKKAFAAFCYSYNGKEFGGYTNIVGERNYPKERKKYYDSLRKNDTFMDTKLMLKNYLQYKPKNKLIYCDPPYEKTTGYSTSVDFDHKLFWETMRKWSENNVVFVSEYNAPKDFVMISSCKKYSSLSGRGSVDVRTEKLFIHKSFLKKKIYLYLKNTIKSKRKSKRKSKSKSTSCY